MSPTATDPLEQLRREHSEGLAFADRLEAIAREGDEAAVAEGVALVKRYNEEEMERHLQHEEQRIISVLVREHAKHMPLCIRLGREHGELRTLAAGIGLADPCRELAEFARLLREHTRAEDEELLPLVESLFTPEQQAAIVDFEPLPFRPLPVVQP
ncbi:MAG: hemerythrin domain-containing protein [Gammaproteobacteria bacterium]|nr:hemerythrin domain-containing protein [Gammaproteobacteria bacterium]